MSPATGIAFSLLLPPVAAALLMLVSKLIPCRSAEMPAAVPVAGTALAVSFLVRWLIAGPSASGLPDDPALARFGLLNDDLAALWQLGCLIAGLLVLTGLRQPCVPEQISGLLLATGATAMAGCSGDLLTLLVCLELAAAGAALACSGLTQADLKADLNAVPAKPASHRPLAGIVPLVLAGLGTVLLYGACGTTRLMPAAKVMESAWLSTGRTEPAGEISLAAMAGAVLLLAGVGFRLPVFPPPARPADAEDVSASQTVLLQTFFPRAAAAAILLRLAETILPVLHEPAVVALLVLCVLMALAGGLQLLMQRAPCECSCWLLMVQSAVWLPGLMAAILLESPAAAGTVEEAAGSADALRLFLVVVFFAETCAVAGLLLLLGHWRNSSTPVKWHADLAGLIRTRPVSAVVLAILLLAAAGFPPLMPFWTRLLLLQATVSVHLESAGDIAPLLHPGLLAAGLAGAAGLACGMVAVLRLLSIILLEPPRRSHSAGSHYLPLLTAALLALCLVAGGLTPLLWWPGQSEFESRKNTQAERIQTATPQQAIPYQSVKADTGCEAAVRSAGRKNRPSFLCCFCFVCRNLPAGPLNRPALYDTSTERLYAPPVTALCHSCFNRCRIFEIFSVSPLADLRRHIDSTPYLQSGYPETGNGHQLTENLCRSG